ncbi:6-carboxytetrahydropterin synthase QueD [Chloroflexota bacterium]
MYEVRIEQEFDAAHYLRGYQGKCEALHGHRYRVVVSVKSAQLNAIGLAYDFIDLKRHLNDILARFDHTCINDVQPFDQINASAENIARTIYQELEPKLVGAPVSISSVEVWETPQTRIIYTPD